MRGLPVRYHSHPTATTEEDIATGERNGRVPRRRGAAADGKPDGSDRYLEAAQSWHPNVTVFDLDLCVKRIVCSPAVSRQNRLVRHISTAYSVSMLLCGGHGAGHRDDDPLKSSFSTTRLDCMNHMPPQQLPRFRNPFLGACPAISPSPPSPPSSCRRREPSQFPLPSPASRSLEFCPALQTLAAKSPRRATSNTIDPSPIRRDRQE